MAAGPEPPEGLFDGVAAEVQGPTDAREGLGLRTQEVQVHELLRRSLLDLKPLVVSPVHFLLQVVS